MKTDGKKRVAARAPRAPSGAAGHVAETARAADTGREEISLDFLPTRAPAAPRSGPRYAVFIDVENTSSEIDLVRVLEDLNIDRAKTDLTAVGNWRVVGQQLGRMLAQRGAHLVHSAPAPRVPDWSDLWIAVTAGMWLGRAAPGDALDILSDDRAFDAVGDAAARLGVKFRRITYRTAGALAERATAEDGGGKRRRRRRRHGEGGGHAAHAPAAHAHHAQQPAPPLASDEERHAASLDQIRAAIARLTASDPPRGVSLDTLTLALKAEGFQRPPGSPRLVTRLRRIKDVEMLPNGRVRLVGETAEIVSAAVEGTYDAAPASTPDAPAATGKVAASNGGVAPAASATKPAAKRRSRRRGGRGRRGGRRRAAGAPESAG
ncbi:MAG: hypothetical protein E6J72_19825 [Deltaproteobacteria bacterium]|nr:MAG: hypothetical protein E6J72_19825 [Deltaproteobacteria bacterium]